MVIYNDVVFDGVDAIANIRYNKHLILEHVPKESYLNYYDLFLFNKIFFLLNLPVKQQKSNTPNAQTSIVVETSISLLIAVQTSGGE